MQTGLEMTISAGSATYPGDGSDAEDLLSAADMAMYKAKETSPARLRAQRTWAVWQKGQSTAHPVQ